MTLCVSLRVPDGVIAAADSLATAVETLQLEAELKGICPECNKEIALHDVALPMVQRAASTSETALKMQSLFGQFAVTHFGVEFLHGKSVYRQVKDFERESPSTKAKETAERLLAHMDTEFRAEGHDMDALPDGAVALGLQVSGYDDTDELAGNTYVIRIGKNSDIRHYGDSGCTVSGDQEVVIKLWKEEEGLRVPKPSWGTLSLQDAIDYADFLIRTTADYQRFAPTIPTVGGPVDIALVTQYEGFRWIRRKDLVRLLSERG